MSSPQSTAPQWLAAAQQLRLVRQACLKFLDHWVDHRLGDDRRVDRVTRDVETALADPQNHDWKLLYRGSVLDD